jgi:hypothetical protein
MLLRFEGISIPAGSHVTSATLQSGLASGGSLQNHCNDPLPLGWDWQVDLVVWWHSRE